jgi:hypothetical protein
MKRLYASLLAIVLAFVTPATLRADMGVGYPDGSVAYAFYVGNAVAFVSWDIPGDGDIFTLHSDMFAYPHLAALRGIQPAFAYWLDLIGVNMQNRLVFNAYADVGYGWFFVRTFVL